VAGRSRDQVYRAAHGSDTKYPDRRAGESQYRLGRRDRLGCAAGSRSRPDRRETTFGKGLVQTVFQITENTGLALTTYHYYTPSGRLIQRNYSNISLYDYYTCAMPQTSPKDKANLEVKLHRLRPYGLRRRRDHARPEDR